MRQRVQLVKSTRRRGGETGREGGEEFGLVNGAHSKAHCLLSVLLLRWEF